MAAKHRKSSRTFIATSLIGTILGLGGCVSYTNVPEPTSAPAFESMDHFQSIKVTRKALKEVIYRYPMSDEQGRYSVNLPVGTSIESAKSIVNTLPEGVVIPFEGMDESIPLYHIGRIWIRATDAKVDVLYPARAFDGSSFMGTVTVWMNGGVQPWRVSRVQHWTPGTIPTPPLYVPLPREVLNAGGLSDDQTSEPPAEDQPEEAASADETTQAPEPMPEPQEESEPQAEPESDPNAMYRQVPVDD